MAHQGAWIRALIVGAVLSGTGLASTDAFAQCCQGGSATGANMWTNGLETSAQWPANVDTTSGMIIGKAPPESAGWWTHGEIEVGGRGFLNSPMRGGSIFGDINPNPANYGTTGGYGFLGQKSLAKYYEYSTVAPGAFGGGHVATGSYDGLYQVDLWANNVASNFAGFSDQAYLLQASKVGEQYFWFNWDQTPHVYSTSAQTIFQGVGSTNLTVPAGLVANPVSTTSVNLNAHAPQAGGILLYLYGIDLGIQRNTASAGYRWTPPDPSRPEGYAWDFRVDYSHMDRTGTQPAGIVELGGFQPTNVPAPVNDTTQNFGANGEYSGFAPWGGRYTVKLAYNGSVYTDNISSYTVQNPFYPALADCVAPSKAAPGTANCVSAQMSTPPSNAANGVSETTTADLPLQSHYVGTFSYVDMTQNATFLPMTNNPLAVTSPFGPNWNQVNFGFINGNLANPTSSLNGQINEFLTNNVLTTKITPELTNKLTYRFYDFDNQTPQIVFPCWISYDGAGGPASPGNPCGPPAVGHTSWYETTLSSLSISYIKQNAGEELNWRPNAQWNFNGGFGWERYDYTEADAGYTNEYSGKLSADWKPTNWLTARLSGSYADRIAGNYDYLANVAAIQYPILAGFTPQCAVLGPSCGGWVYSSAYQQFMFDNRQRTTANFLLDVVAFPGVTITPSVKYKDDYYPLNTANTPATAIPEGISDQKSFSTGVDVGWVITRDLAITASYYYEYYHQLLYSGTGTTAPTAATLVNTTDNEFVNTVTVGVTWAAIPNRLNLDARYSISDGIDKQSCSLCTTAANPGNPFPNNTTLFERVDATATYKFDPTWLRQMGFKGDVLARLRYTWERNSVTNWQNDPLAPFDPIGVSNAIWMAWDNPNYNVQMLSGSIVFRW